MSRRALAASCAVLVLLAVGVLGAGGWFAFQAHAAEQAQGRRQAILRAARQEALDLTSLSYRSLDRDIRQMLNGTTGSFEKQLAGSQRAVRQALPQAKAVTRGEVLAAGITTAGRGSATVLLAVDQLVKNSATRGAGSGGGQRTKTSGGSSEGVLRHYRMQMVLQHESGRWLVAKLEFVP